METADHYDNPAYQRSVALERMAINGLHPETVYLREALFALRSAEMDKPDSFAEDAGILDVACGACGHAFIMNDHLGGHISVLAADPSIELGKIAEQKFHQRYSDPLRSRISFLFDPQKSKMQNLNKLGMQGRKIKLITALGSSFAYTNVDDTIRCLRNFHGILEDGGKLVIQWRQLPHDIDSPEHLLRISKARRISHSNGIRWADDGEIDGEKARCFISDTGEKCFVPGVDCDHPDADNYSEYFSFYNDEIGPWHGKLNWMHTHTGIAFNSFRRIYFNEEGERIDLPKTITSDVMWENKDTGVSILKQLLGNAGFTKIEFKQPQTEDEWLGPERLLAIVCTK